ncbi:unnamed protein product, partial [Gulo gulo]
HTTRALPGQETQRTEAIPQAHVGRAGAIKQAQRGVPQVSNGKSRPRDSVPKPKQRPDTLRKPVSTADRASHHHQRPPRLTVRICLRK